MHSEFKWEYNRWLGVYCMDGSADLFVRCSDKAVIGGLRAANGDLTLMQHTTLDEAKAWVEAMYILREGG